MGSRKLEAPVTRLVHIWHHCHGCGAAPIVGVRYECQQCVGSEVDFCAACYDAYLQGKRAHPVEKKEQKMHHFTATEGKPDAHCAEWLQVVNASARAPAFASEGFVVRPLFFAGDDFCFGSSGFVVELSGVGSIHEGLENKLIFLTALHVMYELIKIRHIDATGANANYTGQEVVDIMDCVKLFDLFAPNWMAAQLGSAEEMLVLPDARVRDEEPKSSRDIAAFVVANKDKLSPGKLAEKIPSVGEPVWLVASLVDLQDQHLHAATVVEQTADSLIFKYVQPFGSLFGTSGAPILNADGEVVAINIGGGSFQGVRLGHGNHVGNIRRHLI